MLKIDRESQTFSLLDKPTLADVSITERYDLQEFISNSPEAFFKEIGQDLFLVGKEVEPSKNVQDRIDLLAVDKEGACVVFELKRGNHKLHMLQAISYAGMVSQWGPDEVLQSLDDSQEEALFEFLETDRENLNRQQKIILVAEAYDYALLAGAEWLSEQHGVEISCCRIAMATDASTGAEYLVCSNVYPAPELTKEAIPRGRRRSTAGKAKWADWEAALADIDSQPVRAYLEQELAADRESYLPRRALRYRISGKGRWNVAARKKSVYVWQKGRFLGDEEFWKEKLSQPENVKPVKEGKCLRFSLMTADDIAFFHESATAGLLSTDWLAVRSNDEAADVDPEDEM